MLKIPIIYTLQINSSLLLTWKCYSCTKTVQKPSKAVYWGLHFLDTPLYKIAIK